MPLPRAAIEHYRQQQMLSRNITSKLRRIWAGIDAGDLTASWQAAADGAFAQLSAGQFLAAGLADDYLDAVLEEQSIDIGRAASINARSFAGRASDGRSLDSLLLEPIIATKAAIAGGATITSAMTTGEASLVRIVSTQVVDAGRTAVGAGMVARPAVTTWTRMLNPPSCSRCTVLAGRVYRYNQGFDRHPLCDCTHVPTTEDLAGDIRTNPRSYFDSLSAADQEKYFGPAGAQAIREGADIGQVVNARRGMYQADGQTFTNVGTTKRGASGRRAPGERRPMPESIVADADGDRELMVEQLRRFGYLN